MLEAAQDDGRQQHERCTVGLRQQERHDRQLGHVELRAAHDALERSGRRRDVGEVEPDEG
jgi:hypothetical protein